MCHPLFRSTELNSKHSNLFEISTSGDKQNVNGKSCIIFAGRTRSLCRGGVGEKRKKGRIYPSPCQSSSTPGMEEGKCGVGFISKWQPLVTALEPKHSSLPRILQGARGGKGDWVGANVRNHVTWALHESLVDFLIMWLKMVEVDGGLNRRAGV